MTIRSSIPAVVTATLSMLTTAMTGQVSQLGSPVTVIDGELGPNVPPEYVQVLGVSGGRQVWATIGKQRRDEHFDVVGMVRVYVGGDDQAYCRQRCYDLLALVETALDNDPSLSGATNIAAQFAATDLRMGVTDTGGRAAEVDFTISVSTQLIAT